MTKAQEAGLAKLKAAGGSSVILHVGIGGALVKAGYAVKDTTSGHGKLMGSYRAIA